jgi:hypothetical protein
MLCSSEKPLVGRNSTQRAAARETSYIVHSCQLWRKVLLEIPVQSKPEHTPPPKKNPIKSLEWLGLETCFRKGENEKIKATDLNILYKIS